MYADIESLVLSGELFNGKERSSSPTRSNHSSDFSDDEDKGWHDDELPNAKAPSTDNLPQQESIGMGPGRTGVKGVIRDRDEAAGIEQQNRRNEMEKLRIKMESSHLGGKTFLEEEREKDGGKVDELVLKEWEQERHNSTLGKGKGGRFGHLREVGSSGFVNAVEKEDKDVWVVVHIYEPSLDRCEELGENLIQLARSYPDTKFLRCRASALGFASSRKPQLPSQGRYDTIDEEDDLEEEKYDYEDDDVDLDMLPTMLVYRGGQLVHNWVRVDWEADRQGIDELLERNHILPKRRSLLDSMDGEDDSYDDLDWD